LTIDAAESVCSTDSRGPEVVSRLLSRLVDQSLVAPDLEAHSAGRFRLLETVQQYAHERLMTAGDFAATRSRHCGFFVLLAEQGAKHISTSPDLSWHRKLALELGNFREALAWSRDNLPESNARLSSALTEFWYWRGLIHEAETWISSALQVYTAPDELRARTLLCGAQIAYWRNDSSSHDVRGMASLDLYRDLGDRSGIAAATERVAHSYEWAGDVDTSRQYFETALGLAVELDDVDRQAHVARQLGRICLKTGHYREAKDYLRQSVTGHESRGDFTATAWSLGYLGLTAIETGDFRAAHTILERALRLGLDHQSGIPVATSLLYLAVLASAESDHSRALRLAGAAHSLAAAAGVVPYRLTRPIIDRWIEISRRDVGPSLAAAYWTEGEAMTQESAVAYALENDDGG
jgi:tetratricopeptide (TPR) repeat protein